MYRGGDYVRKQPIHHSNHGRIIPGLVCASKGLLSGSVVVIQPTVRPGVAHFWLKLRCSFE